MTLPVRIICFSILLVFSFSTLAAPFSIEAQSVISKVHTAAKNKDTVALKKLMVTEFIWSFGGDANAEQAIQAWKADKSIFKKMYRATGQDCIEKSDYSIECPKNAGTGYRAGFKKTTEGWRMFYFVAGD